MNIHFTDYLKYRAKIRSFDLALLIEPMNQLHYFEAEDVLHLLISEGEEYNTLEISPNVTAEMNANGELIGIEILNASQFLRNVVLESVQAKLMNLHVSKLKLLE